MEKLCAIKIDTYRYVEILSESYKTSLRRLKPQTIPDTPFQPIGRDRAVKPWEEKGH